MSSKVSKHATGSWCFSFYNSEKTPNRKWFYFPPDQFTKRQVREIRDQYNFQYKKGEFDPWGGKPKDTSITVEEAVGLYKKVIPRELSENTVSYTETWLDIFLKEAPKRCSDLSKNDLSDFINSYENYNTRRTVDYVLCRFVDWLHARGHISDPIQISMSATEAEKKQQRRYPITSSQLPDLIKGFEAVRDEKLAKKHTTANIIPVYDRHIEMTHILFYMGLRMSDIIHLRPAWIIDEKLLRIGDLKEWGLKDEYHPKSQKEFDLPIAIPKEVNTVLLGRAEKYSRFERIFEIKHARRFQEPFKIASTKAFGKSFAKHFTPHSLRHSCATYWLNERRVPVQEVQRLMRHADIKTTMGYYHPSTEAHLEAFL